MRFQHTGHLKFQQVALVALDQVGDRATVPVDVIHPLDDGSSHHNDGASGVVRSPHGRRLDRPSLQGA